MDAYQKIKNKVQEMLLPLGFAEARPDAEMEGHGSVRCVFAKGEKKFLVWWDAEEGMGSIEAWVDGDWVMLETVVPESAEAEFAGHLNSLCTELKSYL